MSAISHSQWSSIAESGSNDWIFGCRIDRADLRDAEHPLTVLFFSATQFSGCLSPFSLSRTGLCRASPSGPEGPSADANFTSERHASAFYTRASDELSHRPPEAVAKRVELAVRSSSAGTGRVRARVCARRRGARGIKRSRWCHAPVQQRHRASGGRLQPEPAAWNVHTCFRHSVPCGGGCERLLRVRVLRAERRARRLDTCTMCGRERRAEETAQKTRARRRQ